MYIYIVIGTTILPTLAILFFLMARHISKNRDEFGQREKKSPRPPVQISSNGMTSSSSSGCFKWGLMAIPVFIAIWVVTSIIFSTWHYYDNTGERQVEYRYTPTPTTGNKTVTKVAEKTPFSRTVGPGYWTTIQIPNDWGKFKLLPFSGQIEIRKGNNMVYRGFYNPLAYLGEIGKEFKVSSDTNQLLGFTPID